MSAHDIYLCIVKPVDSSLVMRPVKPPEFWACASPEYLSRSSALDTPNDLSDHSLLSFSRFGQTANWVFNHVDKNEGICMDMNKSWLSFTNYAMGRIACLNHGGVTVIPRNMVERDVLEGRLRRLLVQYKVGTMKDEQKIHLVYTKEKLKIP